MRTFFWRQINKRNKMANFSSSVFYSGDHPSSSRSFQLPAHGYDEYRQVSACPTASEAHKLDQILGFLQKQQIDMDLLQKQTIGKFDHLSAQMQDLEQRIECISNKQTTQPTRRTVIPRSASVSVCSWCVYMYII